VLPTKWDAEATPQVLMCQEDMLGLVVYAAVAVA